MELVKRVFAAVLCCNLSLPASQVLGEPAPEGQSAEKTSHRPEYQSGQLRGDQRILHALNRFTFGPRPGDLEAVRAIGLEQWFDQQLHPEALDESLLNEKLARFPAMQWTTQELFHRLPTGPIIRQAMNGKAPVPESGALHAVYENQIYRAEMRQAKKQAEAQVATVVAAQAATSVAQAATAGAAQAPSAPGAGEMSSAAAMEPESGSTASMGMSQPAAGRSVAEPEKAMESGRAADEQPLADESLIAGVLALPPEQRIARLVKMEPQQFEAFVKTLRPGQRAALTANLNPDQKETLGALENPQQLLVNELFAERLTRDIDANAQLQEVMTDFWLNHFNVYLRKNEMAPAYLVSYERDVVRPLALGKFEDLLEAVAHSPEMMLYLDNASSIGPDSMAAERAEVAKARRPGKKAAPEGLNENYARELMELHTLGVDGGYTQADVTQVARVLTGWGVEQPARGGGFVFQPERHEPGTKHVLGAKIKENGEMEGRELLHLLVTQPATARFLSRKLAERFVSDDPPQALIDRMAQSYMASGGDISAVLKTLFHSPEFWSPGVYQAKVKTPLEFVVSAVRASGATVDNYQPLANALNKMGMPLFGCIPPTGYHWDAATWVSTAAMVDRMNFAMALASNRLPGINVTWVLQSAAQGGANAGGAPDPQEEETRLESLLAPDGVSATTREAILKPFTVQTEDKDETSPPVASMTTAVGRGKSANPLEQQDQTLAGMLLGSPEFQRR